MPAMEPLYRLMGISTCNLSKKETIILEAKLFGCVCEELKLIFKKQYEIYFRLLKFNDDQENTMLESDFTRLIIKDILSSEDYSIDGIARYTDTHLDVIQEIYSGRNTNPSARLLRRIIELHYSIRRDLYNMIMQKITTQQTTTEKGSHNATPHPTN